MTMQLFQCKSKSQVRRFRAIAKIAFFPLLPTLLAGCMISTALAQSKTRTLVFPQKCVGKLGAFGGKLQGCFVGNGRPLVDAIGQLHVPKDQLSMLVVNLYGVSNLAFLQRLKADDLVALDFSNGTRGYEDLNDAAVQNMIGLTGLRSLKMEKSDVGDRGMELITNNLQQLQSLNIGGTIVTARGARGLSKLKNLEYFYCSFTALDDTVIEAIKDLAKLESVNLNHTQITAARLKSLSGLTRLENLALAGCKLGDPGIGALPKFPRLRDLYISSIGMSDDSLATLVAKYPNLVHLDVSCSKKTRNGGLHSLCKLQHLIELNVSGQSRSFDELSVLTGIKSLKKLIVSGTASDRAILSKKFPQCEIVIVRDNLKANPDNLPPDLFAPLR
jgi:Leucine-rich repeat (LRR) protein